MKAPFDFLLSSASAKSVFVVSLTILLAVVVDNVFRSLIRVPKHLDNRHARTYIAIFRNSITVVVYAIALHIIFLELGINIAPLLASAGIIGVVVGIGARSIVEDLLSGMFLLSQRSIAVGDYIRVDDSEGYVETIGFRTLSIRADDGTLAIIPNGQVKRVINFSRHRSNVFVDVTVKSDQKIDRVLSVMKYALSELQAEEGELGSTLYAGSSIDGIESYTADGRMVVRATIITSSPTRKEVARKYRYLVKKGFESKRLVFG